MAEIERVREQIAKYLYEQHGRRLCDTFEELKDKWWNSAETYFQQADYILKLVLVKSDDQSLPSFDEGFRCFAPPDMAYKIAQQDMLKEGWVKVIKND